MPAERLLDEMRDLGLEATELGPPGFLPASADALRARLDGSGLRLVAGFLAVDPRRPAGGALPEALERTARLVAAAGAEVLVLAAAGAGDGYDRRQRLDAPEWRGLAQRLRAARDLAQAHGLALAVHPHVGTLVEDADDVSCLLELTDADLCLDTGHLAVAGVEPLEVARAAAGRVRHVHLKDVDGELAREVRSGRIPYAAAVAKGLYRPLGQGSVDVAELVRHLQARAFRGWYVLEQDVMLSAEPRLGEGPVRAVRESLRWLHELMDHPVSRAATR
jgi:inosose dehydratase